MDRKFKSMLFGGGYQRRKTVCSDDESAGASRVAINALREADTSAAGRVQEVSERITEMEAWIESHTMRVQYQKILGIGYMGAEITDGSTVIYYYATLSTPGRDYEVVDIFGTVCRDLGAHFATAETTLMDAKLVVADRPSAGVDSPRFFRYAPGMRPYIFLSTPKVRHSGMSNMPAGPEEPVPLKDDDNLLEVLERYADRGNDCASGHLGPVCLRILMEEDY